MNDRVAEYKEKKLFIDWTIEEHLRSHEDTREDTTEKMTTQERTLRDTFQRNTLSKMKETDEKEKMNSYEYLLKYTDSSSSLNYRGGHFRQYNRTPYRGKRGQQEFWTSAPPFYLLQKLNCCVKDFHFAPHHNKSTVKSSLKIYTTLHAN